MLKHKLIILIFQLCIFTFSLFSLKSYAIDIRHKGQKSLNVSFEPIKSVYKVGEPIYFRVTANKSFFLYILNIKENSNRAYVLLPNELQQMNRYIANRQYIVPNKNIEYYSENSGIEKVLMVASIKELPLQINKLKKSGIFPYGKFNNLKKRLRVFNKDPLDSESQVKFKEISLIIKGSSISNENNIFNNNSQDHTGVFISSDRIEYNVNDLIKISFGADKAGFLSLYSFNPLGEITLIKKQPVSGRNFYQIFAEASYPIGQYKVCSIFTTYGQIDQYHIKLYLNKDNTGIKLSEKDLMPYAIYSYIVK